MWLCENRLKGKTAHFRLPSASQKRACLSSRIRNSPAAISFHEDNSTTGRRPHNSYTLILSLIWTLFWPEGRELQHSNLQKLKYPSFARWGFAKSRPASQRPSGPRPSPAFPQFLTSGNSTHMHRSGLGVQHGRRWVWIRLPLNHLNRLTMQFLSIGFCQQKTK